MKNTLSILVITILICYSCNHKSGNNKSDDKTTIVAPPVVAPFTGIDTIATNDWWNRKPNEIIDVNVKREDVIAFGMYTTHNNILKLTAQLFPLYPEETREIRLAIKSDGKWKEIQNRNVNDLGWSALFRIENWDSSKRFNYRILHGDQASYEGVIRKDPIDKKEIVLAALSCNSNKDRGNRDKYLKNINYQNPDIVFFAGDQSYDHSEHTAAWLKFGMQFREVFRNRPCITIPDDHDVGQGKSLGGIGKKGFYCSW